MEEHLLIMRGFIANTDVDWFRYLRDQPFTNEVNFWRPSGNGSFAALQPGEPLVFKLKKAHGHRVVGFGLMLSYTPMTVGDAWSYFGTMNGAASRSQMQSRVTRYVSGKVMASHRIGAILLVSPVFFPDSAFVDAPEDWSDNIVAGKTYDLSTGVGARIWSACIERARSLPVADDVRTNLDVVLEAGRHGRPRLVAPRLGQGTFRLAVADAYGRCAVTGEHSLPALEAAHIVPYADSGPHSVDNGLLLRADIHRLYDRHYVSVTPDLLFTVSDRLRSEFRNGKLYYALNGRRVHLPEDPAFHPRREFLEHHYDSFRAAS